MLIANLAIPLISLWGRAAKPVLPSSSPCISISELSQFQQYTFLLLEQRYECNGISHSRGSCLALFWNLILRYYLNWKVKKVGPMTKILATKRFFLLFTFRWCYSSIISLIFTSNAKMLRGQQFSQHTIGQMKMSSRESHLIRKLDLNEVLHVNNPYIFLFSF